MNIIEYAVKNGIYDFSEREFNVVDSLIISQLSYLKFDGLIYGPASGKPGVVLSELNKPENKETLLRDERYADINNEFFDALCNSKRFGKLIINNFIDIIDDTIDIQFSAMTVEDGKGFVYVVFRGTDDSLIGWKEDLNMTFKTPVPAQKYSVEYLEKVSEKWDGGFYVGGHSKGGNLAVYSSMMCKPEIRDRIIHIFSHDGPGFRTEILQNSSYNDIEGRITKLIPKSAVVGLFGNLERYEVVDCEKRGVKQHNPYNWIVDEFDFKRVEHIGRYSDFKSVALHIWASDMKPEHWALLSDEIFGVFEAAGVTNLNDFNDDFFGTLARVRAAVDEMDGQAKETIKEMLAQFRETATILAKDEARENAKAAEHELTKVKDEAVQNINKARKATAGKMHKSKKKKAGSKKKTMNKEGK